MSDGRKWEEIEADPIDWRARAETAERERDELREMVAGVQENRRLLVDDAGKEIAALRALLREAREVLVDVDRGFESIDETTFRRAAALLAKMRESDNG